MLQMWKPDASIQTCPVYSTERHGFEQQTAAQQQAPSRQKSNVRPVKDRLNEQDKTCIWVKYRRKKISALIDTGSDVSIAGEDVARKMGWTIHPHRTKEVSVANNEDMAVLGAAYVVLSVAG